MQAMQEVVKRIRDNMPAVKQGDEPGRSTDAELQEAGPTSTQTNWGECLDPDFQPTAKYG
jgi:hypothetical protein